MLNIFGETNDYRLYARPGFDELFKVFSDNPEYMNLTELLLTQAKTCFVGWAHVERGGLV